MRTRSDLIADSEHHEGYGQPHRYLDASRATRAFGLTVSTPLDVGLRRTIEWHLRQLTKKGGSHD